MYWRLPLILLIVLLEWSGLSQAQPCASGGQGFTPVDYQEFTVDATTPVAINLAQLPAAATNLGMAYVSVEGETIRFRFGGGVPSSTSGHEVAP